MNIRITERHYREMRRLTSVSFMKDIDFPPETGCILLVGQNNHPTHPSLLVAEVLAPESGELVEQGYDGLVLSSRYMRRALFRVRERHLAGFLTVHTHPMSDMRVDFSPYDDANDPSLMANLYELEPEGIFGSMVLGKRSASGRLWEQDGRLSYPLDELVIVGEQLQFLPLNGIPLEDPPQAAAIFDRSLAVTNSGALSRLSRMRIGLVGGSGTGSIIAELLVRAGAGEVLLFEPDCIEEVNLNRMLYSRRSDVEAGAGKAARLAEGIGESGLPTRIIVDPCGDIRHKQVALELRSCDLVIGCVDRDWPRLILCELAYQYLIPYIDIGTEIGLGESEIQSLDSRVSYVAPERPCLCCSGVVSNERVRLEGMAEDERDRVIAMGYCEDIRLIAPAVMDLNMRPASYAMLVVRHLLQPFLDSPLPTHIKESLTNFSTRPVTLRRDPECPVCSIDIRLGMGDSLRLTTIR
jgi:molybdopterin/thiamine biosynthesis adenylyltransferase